MTYEVKKICACEFVDEKNPAKALFRITRQTKDASYKNLDFEAPLAVASAYSRPLNRGHIGITSICTEEAL